MSSNKSIAYAIIQKLSTCSESDAKQYPELTEIEIGRDTFNFFTKYSKDSLISNLPTFSLADLGIIVLSAKSVIGEQGVSAEFEELVSIYGAFSPTRTIVVLVTDLESKDNDSGQASFNQVKSQFFNRLNTLKVKYKPSSVHIIPIEYSSSSSGSQSLGNICSKSQSLAWSSTEPLVTILNTLPRLVRQNPTGRESVKLAVLDASEYSLLLFALNGQLVGTTIVDYYNSCPGELRFSVSTAENLAGEEIDEIKPGMIFKGVGIDIDALDMVCKTQEEFPCRKAIGRGTVVNISERRAECEVAEDGSYSVDVVLNSNAAPIQLSSDEKVEIWYGGTFALVSFIEVIYEYIPHDKYPTITESDVKVLEREKWYWAEIKFDTPSLLFSKEANPSSNAFIIRQPNGPIIGFGSFRKL